MAQSPSAYMLSHPSTRSHSSVAKTRLLACFKETQLLNEVVNEHKKRSAHEVLVVNDIKNYM